ncbi:carboxymuconolactone decarboxylase family protein [Chryseobacterium taichungense]|uniref:carboxymuconolactone decarboxylase family protein n=1 Tax=Chryseobacterium taichungense TaxID=295069 RepID=UPI0028AD4DD6|nr:carboxymuconolactone decarboxylase family protein [Chryseobacterium taichungense]
MAGFSEENILEFRGGKATFDTKLDALAKFTTPVVKNRGKATRESAEAFFEAGYTEANMIDVIMVVGDKIISNYIHNLTQLEIDFPLADQL